MSVIMDVECGQPGVLESGEPEVDLLAYAGDGHGIVHAPAGLLRVAADAIAKVRALHAPFAYEGVVFCKGCWDQPGSGSRLLYPCPTTKALDAPAEDLTVSDAEVES